MSTPFRPTSNFEVYCYLKHALEPCFEVQSFPSTSYYSEWLYHYEISRDGKTVETLQGDFRDLEPGALVKRAEEIVAHLRESDRC